MDSEKPIPPTKSRFAPKPQKRRVTRSSAVPKTEKLDDVDVEAQQRLLQRFNERSRRRQPKVETPAQVVFTNEVNQFTSARVPDGYRRQRSAVDWMEMDDTIGQPSKSLSSTAGTSEDIVSMKDSTDDLSPEMDYVDPWDYTTYYPTSLPWRRPSCVHPDILNEAEFGEAARKEEYDETSINTASELGFLNPDETGNTDRLLLFQLPQSLPQMKRFASAKGKEKEGSFPPSNQKGSVAFGREASSNKGGIVETNCTLEELSAGQMGKLLVYKSGAVKLKLGDILYNVSPGMDCTFAQNVAAIDTGKKVYCEIGDLDRRAIVTPDIDYLLDRVIDLV